jgi:hypothetical protein
MVSSRLISALALAALCAVLANACSDHTPLVSDIPPNVDAGDAASCDGPVSGEAGALNDPCAITP